MKHKDALADSLGDADERRMAEYRIELDKAREQRLATERNNKKKVRFI